MQMLGDGLVDRAVDKLPNVRDNKRADIKLVTAFFE